MIDQLIDLFIVSFIDWSFDRSIFFSSIYWLLTYKSHYIYILDNIYVLIYFIYLPSGNKKVWLVSKYTASPGPSFREILNSVLIKLEVRLLIYDIYISKCFLTYNLFCNIKLFFTNLRYLISEMIPLEILKFHRSGKKFQAT